MNTPSSKEILKQLDLLLNQVGLNKIVSVSLAKWASGQYWLLMEGELAEEKSTEANFLRDILDDIQGQWECLCANNEDIAKSKGTEYLEFPKNLIEEWKQTVQRSLGISHGKLTIP